MYDVNVDIKQSKFTILDRCSVDLIESEIFVVHGTVRTLGLPTVDLFLLLILKS